MFEILKDAYDEGFHLGLLHARKDKKRSAFSFGSKEGFNYLTGIANREQYFNSFMKGYNIGFLDGLREKNLKFALNLKQLNMARGIDGQIEMLQQMRYFLDEFIDTSNDLLSKYQLVLQQLDSELLDQRMLQRLEESFTETRSKISSICDSISSEDIGYISQNVRHLEETPR